MHPPDHNKVTLGVVGKMQEAFARELAQRFPRLELAPASADDLDALLVWQQQVDDTVAAIGAHPRLRWVHLRWAGVPAAVVAALDGSETVLTNGSGAHGLAVAEYVVGVVLQHHKGFLTMHAAQARKEWLVDFKLRELRASLVGIVGLGDLGGSIARVLRGFGVRLRGLRRSAGACSEVDELFQTARLADFVAGLDVLIVAAPLTTETRGLIGSAELARLKPGALLVNVGRAAVVDQAAMVEALRSGQLGGAALDVFEEEPLAPDSQLWTTPGVFISPHCCDATPQSQERGLGILLDNVERFLAGKELENVVDRAAGY